MSDSPAPTPPPARRSHGWIAWLIVAVLAIAAGAWGWNAWQARNEQNRERQADAGQRLDAVEGRIDAIRRDQRSQLQRLQQADATNRVLRDEVLGIGQRSSLIEDTVSRLADPNRYASRFLGPIT